MHVGLKNRGESVSRFLGTAALVLLVCILTFLTVGSLTTLAELGFNGPYGDSTEFLRENVLSNLVLTAAAIAAMLGMRALLERFMGVRLTAGMMGLWLAASVIWVTAVGLISESDFACVIDSAGRFAQSDYELLHWGYFRGSSYQLGICLVLESITRLLPTLNIDLVMQCLNVAMSVGFMGLLAAFGQEVFGVSAKLTLSLYVLYLPAVFYNHYVYGTLPTLLCGALACFCFAQYLKKPRVRLLGVISLAMAVGYLLKPNGIVVTIALLICAVLYALECRDIKPVLCILAAFVLGHLLKRLVILQYEWRAGFPLNENQSFLTWLVMAITPAEGVTPGWYTGYAGEFYDLYLPKEQQSAIVMADLTARLAEIAADPLEALRFFVVKIMSQWLEPSVSVMAYGEMCEYRGVYNGLAFLVFRDGLFNTLVYAYMNLYQQAIYMLALIGTVSLIWKRRNAAAMVLPVIVIGGFLFHTLMEAKSQYIYPYMVYMMPLCALGLDVLGRRIGRRAQIK